MRSFSEIETISKRASRGAGFSWGVSEEIGKSVRLLEMFGLPGILHLKNYLEKINNHNYQKITIISPDNISNNIPYCPISVGVNFLDQAYNLENFKFLFNFNQSIISNFDNSLISKTTNFLISFNQNEDSFDEITWDSLYKISQKTFVDETESSKKTSAGAGLTDND